MQYSYVPQLEQRTAAWYVKPSAVDTAWKMASHFKLSQAVAVVIFNFNKQSCWRVFASNILYIQHNWGARWRSG